MLPFNLEEAADAKITLSNFTEALTPVLDHLNNQVKFAMQQAANFHQLFMGIDMQREKSQESISHNTLEDDELDNRTENLIGRRIRQIRKQRRMSAKELGESAGISRSMVSQIELGRSNASVSVLKAVASTLSVPLFTLFVEDRAGGEIVRREDRAQLRLPGSDIIRELLVPDTRRKMYLISAVFSPGARSSYEPASHKGEECLVIIQGEITVYYHSDIIELTEGDSFYFDATVPHIFANNSDAQADIIVAIST